MLPVLIRIVAFGLVAYIIYRVVRPSYPVKMTLTSDGLAQSKGVSNTVRRIVDEFAREQLLDGETIKLKGFFSEHGRIRWVFPKDANQALAQRFRNLMIAEADQQ